MVREVRPDWNVETQAITQGRVCGACDHFREHKDRLGYGICRLHSRSQGTSDVMSRYVNVSYPATVEVRSIFGCLLHEPKEGK